MVILFLTGSLEPGKDGVGDYTRRLAFECVRQKQACGMISLNDPHVQTVVESAESSEGMTILTLRLPSAMPWSARAERAAEFRSRLSPDWISLQFVSYAFDPKGIVGNLPLYLEQIVGEIPLHVMFHELWIRVGEKPSLKERLVQGIQRHFILKLIRRLNPRVVATTNSFYLSFLKKHGWAATELPLFGNISVCAVGDNFFIPEASVQNGICDVEGSHPGRWLGLFFGTIHPEWKPEPLLGILLSASKKTARRLCLVSAGRLGHSGEAIWKKLQQDYATDADFIALGELPVQQVSALMLRADLGVSASPWHLIGKSGSAVAMLDHGLPVIVTRDDFHTPEFSPSPIDPLLHRCDATLESKLIAGLTKRPAKDGAPKVAAEFIRILMSEAKNETKG